MLVHILILNYDGRARMAECLPSVLRAAKTSQHACEVVVVDNDSTDDSVQWLKSEYPAVAVIHRPNRGLCSFNEVVAELPGQVALLLNNDIRLADDCIDPLVTPLVETPSCFMTAPLCWQFDGETYEGFRTAIDWRWGLVRATALFEGHESGIHFPDLTASAGAALAVDCRRFTELGGFDPLYLPGRIEDLDFAFRGYQAGYEAHYIPDAVAYHQGMATFGQVFGQQGCDHLALRNTLLFQWKNLRHPRHWLSQVGGLPLRLARDVLHAPFVTRSERWGFVRALFGALARWDQLRTNQYRARCLRRRERAFFRRFSSKRMASDASELPATFLHQLDRVTNEPGTSSLPQRHQTPEAAGT